jgi:hypothetical protein
MTASLFPALTEVYEIEQSLFSLRENAKRAFAKIQAGVARNLTLARYGWLSNA